MTRLPRFDVEAWPLHRRFASFIHELVTHPLVAPYTGLPLTDPSSVEQWIHERLASEALGQSITRMLGSRTDGEEIGLASLEQNPLLPADTMELGTWLHPTFFGAGYNVLVKDIMLRLAFASGDVARIVFVVAETNGRANAAIRKLSYVRAAKPHEDEKFTRFRAFKLGQPVHLFVADRAAFEASVSRT